jgi:hypothetical protein
MDKLQIWTKQAYELLEDIDKTIWEFDLLIQGTRRTSITSPAHRFKPTRALKSGKLQPSPI